MKFFDVFFITLTLTPSQRGQIYPEAKKQSQALSMSLSPTISQLKVLAILPMISGSFSIIGSSLIIYRIRIDRKNRLSKVYHRLIYAMSSLDIFQSIFAALSTIPVPKDASPAWANYGNNTSCKLQAFGIVATSGVMFYNCALSLYFFLSIKFGMRDCTLKKVIEPSMHILCLGWPICWAITGLLLNVYNFSGNKCWIAPNPIDCIKKEQVECIEGEFAYSFRWYCSGAPLIITFLVIFVSQFLIYRTIREQDKKMQKYGRNSILSRIAKEDSEAKELISKTQHKTIKLKRIGNRNTALLQRSINRSLAQRSMKVAKRGSAYVATAFMTYIWSLIYRVHEQHMESEPPLFLIFIAQFFFPLQGFFNYFIYTQPEIEQIHENNPEKSRLWALKESITLPFYHSDLIITTNQLQRRRRSALNNVIE